MLKPAAVLLDLDRTVQPAGGGALCSDVAACLRRWHAGGLRLYVYASDSADAQKLLLGELAALFNGFFDPRVGNRHEPASYDRLAIAMNLPPAEVLFLSAGEEELDAASAGGLRTCQIVRSGTETGISDRHMTAVDLADAALRMGLPAAV